MEFTRQKNIFNPEEQKTKITIIGAGSTGSFICLTLAKMGFNKIKVIDFDKVEKHNIPNQFYKMEDVGVFKVEALKKIVFEFTGIEIETENKKIEEDYNFDLDLNSLIVFCVDNIETRELIYNKIKDYPIKLIDTRFGGEGFSIYAIDLQEEELKKEYEKSLKLKIKDTPCGMKAVIYTISSISSECCNIIKKIDKGEDYPKILKRELKTYRFIKK